MQSMNRKELLCQFFRNELSESEIKTLQTQLPSHYHLIYTLFNILRISGAAKEDILNAKIVDGDVKLNLSSKSIAKKVASSDELHPDYVLLFQLYQLHVSFQKSRIPSLYNSDH
jgi:cyanate lyase